MDGGEYSAADADAVAELEADLSSTFEEMESAIANPPAVSSPLKQLRAGIRNVVKQQAILKHGFLAHHFFEQEGSDAMLARGLRRTRPCQPKLPCPGVALFFRKFEHH